MSLALDKNNKNDDGLDIPEFLKISQEDRRIAWEKYKPTQTASSHNQERRYLSETQDMYEARLAGEANEQYANRVLYGDYGPEEGRIPADKVLPAFADELIERLMRLGFIGQVYPYKKGDDRPPMLALIAPVQNALDECKLYLTRGDITRQHFLKFLKANNIRVFDNIDSFVRAKEEYDENTTIEEKEEIEMTPRLKKLLEQLDISDSRVKYKRDGTPLTGIDRAVIHGKNGYIFEDETETKKMHVFVTDQKEQWNSIKKKLSFMRLNENEDQTGGHFTLNRDLTPKEAGAIRKAVGLKKKPQLTDEYRGSLRNRLPKDHAPSEVAFSMGG